MRTKNYLKKIAAMFFCVASFYAASSKGVIVDEAILSRNIPAYFKILTFEKARWEAFVDVFSGHPIAEAIKENLDSIQLAPVVFSREEIFATEFFKNRMRQEYCTLFPGRQPAPSSRVVNSDEMYAAILGLLETDEGAVGVFETYINQEMDLYKKVIAAYNHRLETRGGNSALLKHFLSKIFFAPDAYTEPSLITMRMTLLEAGLVAGDDHLFAEQKNLGHTLAQSISKYIELEGPSDTLVFGCGHSLIADVPETHRFLAGDFLKAYTTKKFVHDCQECFCDHDRQIAVALTERGLKADIDYDGAAHADIYADATVPEFWNALITLKNEGRSSIKCIIDHAWLIRDNYTLVANSLDIGGIFRAYSWSDFSNPQKMEQQLAALAQAGFELRSIENFGERVENIYVKVRSF